MKREKQEWEGYASILSINSRGISGELENISEKPKCFRVTVLGDSYTFGYMVSDDETYPARLPTELSRRKKWVSELKSRTGEIDNGSF
jgi:hypothetical protein